MTPLINGSLYVESMIPDFFYFFLTLVPQLESGRTAPKCIDYNFIAFYGSWCFHFHMCPMTFHSKWSVLFLWCFILFVFFFVRFYFSFQQFVDDIFESFVRLSKKSVSVLQLQKSYKSTMPPVCRGDVKENVLFFLLYCHINNIVLTWLLFIVLFSFCCFFFLFFNKKNMLCIAWVLCRHPPG